MAEDDRYGTVERSQTREENSSSRSVLLLLSDPGRPIHGEHAPLRSSSGNSQVGGENGDEGQRARRFEAFTRPRFASLAETLHLNMSFTILMLVITLTLAVSMIFATAISPNYVSELHRKVGPTEYDFIIVGAGPAGSMLARRLSDDLEKRVLLLEAGMPSQFKLGGEDFLSNPLTPFDIPLMWPSVSNMKDFHWLVKDSTKTDSATGEHPNTLVAKALGGCGIHNAMLYVRALESDFVKWDVEGFDYASAVETWKEIENYTRPGPLPDWHLRGGPISVSPPQFVDEVAPFFLDSCARIGIPTVEDFNKPGGREGAGYYDFTIRSGVRDSVASAMLGDIIMGKDERTNLDILPGALVTRVLFNYSGPSVLLEEDSPEPPSRMKMEGEKEAGVHDIPSATGVEFILNGKLQEARVKKREKGPAIVVTAGALHTPKVLMASGIGNKTELASNKIECVADVPGVGKNLQDHASVGVMYMLGPDLLKLTPSAYTVAQELEKYKNQVLKAFDLDFPLGTTEGGVDHDSHADREDSAPSLFTSAGLSVGAFLRSPYESSPAVGNLSAPDIQLTVFPRVTEPHILALADTRPAAHAPPMMLVTVSVLDPQGRSAVRLQPNNPLLGSPEIHVDGREGAPAPMTELDVEKLAWGVGQVRKIMNTPPLRELTMGEVYPGPGVSGSPGESAGEDDSLLDWVRSHAYSNSHWCGTARMGNVSSNPEIVVDERMAVRGVKRLYIGDASVIPYIPNGNVHSTVVLVATRLAEYLLADNL